MALEDIGDGYFFNTETGQYTTAPADTETYTTPGWTDDDPVVDPSTSSGLPFNLSDIGKLLSGTSSYGMLGQLAGLAGSGALLNKVLGSGSSGGGFAGYQGGIPTLTASRQMLPIPTTVQDESGRTVPRRPGSGGITYFTPMQYLAAGQTPANNYPSQTEPVAQVTNDVTGMPTYSMPDGVGIRAPIGDAKVMASGGIASLGGYSDGGRLLRGPGDGVSDDIPATIGGRQPARLADGEFVVPARIVSELGNGSTEAGARKLYAMMDRIKASRAKAKNIAADTKASKHLPA